MTPFFTYCPPELRRLGFLLMGVIWAIALVLSLWAATGTGLYAEGLDTMLMRPVSDRALPVQFIP